jgi:hypothetical protein
VVLEPMMYDPVKPKTHANAETFLRFAAVIWSSLHGTSIENFTVTLQQPTFSWKSILPKAFELGEAKRKHKNLL